MKNHRYTIFVFSVIFFLMGAFLFSCGPKSPKNDKKQIRTKHNFIILLDLSDRLIVQPDQPQRDKEILHKLYELFEKNVKKNLYIKSRDEIKVVIAPQIGSNLRRDEYEDRLYVNMDKIKNIFRKKNEKQRKDDFLANVDTLYKEAVFSKNPKAYYGADIWKYFYEDLSVDYAKDTLTKNFLFILTDGYPIVGKDPFKLKKVKSEYPGLHVVIVEASPREKDMEWDRIMTNWEEWFEKIGIEKYTLIKRGSIKKEMEQIEELIDE